MAHTIRCSHCHEALFTVQRLRFPLDYRTFIPLRGHDVVEGDPLCDYCERPFQFVPHDISWKKIRMAPVVTDKGIIGPEGIIPEETKVAVGTKRDEKLGDHNFLYKAGKLNRLASKKRKKK